MKLASRLTAPVLLFAVLGLGLLGIRRSLWLDETWVANSIREPSLHGMFQYPGWLQTTPPLFLLLVRTVVGMVGASNANFRIVPLSFAVAAAAFTLAAARRVLTPTMAALATALVVFDGTAIEYSHTLKPYSAELAASSVLLTAAFACLQEHSRKRFAWLLAATAISIPLAYSAVFLLPGIALAIAVRSPRRAAVLAGITVVVLAPVYWFFIRPNVAPELRAFWVNGRDKMTPSMAVAVLFCGFCAVRLCLRFVRGKPSSRDWSYFLCLLPCLLLAAGAAAGFYPVSHRTRLFVLPCFILLTMMTAEDLLRRYAAPRLVEITASVLTLGVAAFAVAGQFLAPANTYEEDFDGAVAFLEHYAAASDLILVHACCREGFELYSTLDHWNPPKVLFGNTGWPCCARGEDALPGSSSASAVIADIGSKIPRGYSGRVWLLYATRPAHWEYTGLNEGDLWRKTLWERGCPPGPYIRFANLAISPMNCAAAR